MYYQIEQVLERYGMGDAQTVKGRGVLICSLGGRLAALKEFAGKEEKAGYLFELGEYLSEHGVRTDCLRKTLDGELTAEGPDGVRYTMHDWFYGRECDVKSRMDIVMAVSALAQFHMITGNFVPAVPYAGYEREDMLSEYQRHNRELRKIRNYIRKKRQKNDFERLFMKYYEMFFSQCMLVEQDLEKYSDVVAESRTGICHGEFNQHNVIFESSGSVILNLEKARRGTQITDLGNFMRKIMEKYGWDEGIGSAMIREYDRICPLGHGDLLQLYYRLAYPEKFWKISNHYFASGKAWISERNKEKLEKEIRQNRLRKKYLMHLEKMV